MQIALASFYENDVPEGQMGDGEDDPVDVTPTDAATNIRPTPDNISRG